MMRKEKRSSFVKVTLILLIVLLLSVLSTLLFYYEYKIVDVQNIYLEFEVGKIIGLTTDTDALHFGRIPRGSGGVRELNLTNSFEYPVKINLRYYSDNMDWVSFNENGFVLSPNENKLVKVMVNVPSNAVEKDYDATVEIVMLRD